MTKKWVDWDETPVKQKPDPLHKHVKKAKGEQALVNQFAGLVRDMVGAADPGINMRQVRPEEEEKVLKAMFPNLANNEEELKKRDEEWENSLNNWYDEIKKPVEKQEPLKKDDWGSRGPVKVAMTEEEKRENMTEEQWRIHKITVSEDSE